MKNSAQERCGQALKTTTPDMSPAFLTFPLFPGRAQQFFTDLLFAAAVDVAVEHRKPRKEGDADQVFHPFDVLVEIDQRVDFLELSN
jgi:hypothetical protein